MGVFSIPQPVDARCVSSVRRQIVSYDPTMLFIRNVTFMTEDPRRLADFWSAALGLPERRDDATETICADEEWTYPRLTFQRVSNRAPEPPRVHLDLTADDRLAEVQRLRALGAREERSVTVEGGWTWTVMTDPDGNEFCVTDP
jgi:catechol 2,3-dioxygenase-like lactoylglutathione lyase family enzyme